MLDEFQRHIACEFRAVEERLRPDDIAEQQRRRHLTLCVVRAEDDARHLVDDIGP